MRAQSQLLSVSSIGTNELQPFCGFCSRLILSSFSFLYRNERTATISETRYTSPFTSFQFPLSERTNCNLFHTLPNVRFMQLSVSSIGTNELQHCFADPGHHATCELSVSSIGTNELQQDWLSPSCRTNKHLSVSSIGTNELQLYAHTVAYENFFFFQFPLSERTNCNLAHHDAKARRRKLSVSSIGTNELQLGRMFPDSSLPTTFSFLYRNERTATDFCQHTLCANDDFQFPLSERTNCNAWHCDCRRMVCHAFSFLYRNERTATSSFTPNESFLTTFSFLYRNERTATGSISCSF